MKDNDFFNLPLNILNAGLFYLEGSLPTYKLANNIPFWAASHKKFSKAEKNKCWVSTNPTDPILAQSWIFLLKFHTAL